MAFLAVLKEGFETSVFLLATFQASSDTGTAAVGAVIGIAVAVAVGYGIYTGGVRLDLGRFFTGTGVFLVFVAGGLVLTALRHAHEAGWLVIGQQRTVDLGWLAPNGSLRGALVTGVLGIPADPRVIEVLGWFLYVVPVLAVAVWPRRWRPSPARVPVVRAAVAAGSRPRPSSSPWSSRARTSTCRARRRSPVTHGPSRRTSTVRQQSCASPAPAGRHDAPSPRRPTAA